MFWNNATPTCDRGAERHAPRLLGACTDCFNLFVVSALAALAKFSTLFAA